MCQLNQKQLSKALFPIGHLLKPEVRKIAEEQELITAKKKDSQGLCFIGKVHLPDFLQQKLLPKKGMIIEIPKTALIYQEERSSLYDKAVNYSYTDEMGTIVGTHNGAHFFTIGQRKGIGVGGKAEPLFVIGIDVDKNLLYVGQGEHHPGLYRPGLKIKNEEVHWVREDLRLKEGESRRYLSRIRYRQELTAVTLFQEEDGLYLVFDEPQRGIAAGQFAAWYDGEELIGSGVIEF